MKNKWNSSEAKKYISHYKKKKISKELALRIYTTHLLGREKDLVLHGGGNTSLKTSKKNIFKQNINVMHIKGSGWDMGSIDYPGILSDKLLKTNEFQSQCDSVLASVAIKRDAGLDLFSYLENSAHRNRLKHLNMEADTKFCLNPTFTSEIIPVLKNKKLIPY